MILIVNHFPIPNQSQLFKRYGFRGSSLSSLENERCITTGNGNDLHWAPTTRSSTTAVIKPTGWVNLPTRYLIWTDSNQPGSVWRFCGLIVQVDAVGSVEFHGPNIKIICKWESFAGVNMMCKNGIITPFKRHTVQVEREGQTHPPKQQPIVALLGTWSEDASADKTNGIGSGNYCDKSARQPPPSSSTDCNRGWVGST